MKPRSATILLGAANVALAAACGLLWSRGRDFAPKGSSQAEVVDSTNTTGSSVGYGGSGSLDKNDPFSYLKIFSRDWKRYIANLRAIECPEETIQDILLGDINRFYAVKEAGLKLRSSQKDPWDPSMAGARRDWDKYEQLRQLEHERVAVIKELLGIDVLPDIPPLLSATANDAFEAALNELPEAKRAIVRAALEEFWSKTQRLQDRVNGLFLPADAEEYRKLRGDRIAALKKVLTPDEFEQFERKTSPVANMLANRLSFFPATDEESRKLFDLQHDNYEEHTLPGQLVGDNGASNQRNAEAQAALEKQFEQTLGPERYAEYRRSQDGTFRQIARQTDDAGLPREVAAQAYDISQQSRLSMQQISSDPQLTAQEKQEQLQNLFNTTADQIHQAVGDKAWPAIQPTLPQYRAPRIKASPVPVQGISVGPNTP